MQRLPLLSLLNITFSVRGGLTDSIENWAGSDLAINSTSLSVPSREILLMIQKCGVCYLEPFMTRQLSMIITALFVGGFSLSASSFPFTGKHGLPNASTQAAPHHERTFVGKAVPLGKGTIYSWVSFKGRQPATIGVTF